MPSRRIPTKKELLHLQKLYRTDKKIGQALGDVSEQLVAYWRRKKGIGRSIFPKYSFSEIRNLWERFGDDEKAGQELGITKQAFYRWRKKYKLIDRPAILRLEQLELKFFDEHRLNRRGDKQTPAQTFLQKLLSYYNEEQFIHIGKSCHSNVNSMVTIDKHGIKVTELSNKDEKLDFKKEERFKSIMEMLESGYFIPGQILLTDRAELHGLSITSSYVHHLSERKFKKQKNSLIELSAYPSISIIVSGNLGVKQSPFTIAAEITEALKSETEKNIVLEISGIAIERLTLEERIALLAYLNKFTALSCFLEPDQTYLSHLQRLGDGSGFVPFSDKAAPNLEVYSIILKRNKQQLYSLASNSWFNDYRSLSSKKIKRVRIGPIIGGSLENIKTLSKALRNRKLPDDLELYIIPSTQNIFAKSAGKKYLQFLLEAGAKVGNIINYPNFENLADGEYELTTELDSKGDNSFLASIHVIAETLRVGKLSKRLIDSI